MKRERVLRTVAWWLLAVGSAMIVMNLTALWEVHDASPGSVTLGLILILLGATTKAGLNLYDEEQSK